MLRMTQPQPTCRVCARKYYHFLTDEMYEMLREICDSQYHPIMLSSFLLAFLATYLSTFYIACCLRETVQR